MFHGPYVRVRLPYARAIGWDGILDWMPSWFTPYHHQAEAFRRLRSRDEHGERRPDPTLVITGTMLGADGFGFVALDLLVVGYTTMVSPPIAESNLALRLPNWAAQMMWPERIGALGASISEKLPARFREGGANAPKTNFCSGSWAENTKKRNVRTEMAVLKRTMRHQANIPERSIR